MNLMRMFCDIYCHTSIASSGQHIDLNYKCSVRQSLITVFLVTYLNHSNRGTICLVNLCK